MDSDYIPLDRRFVPHTPEGEDQRDSLFQFKASTISWLDILKHPRVVILGEAGSGKTTEFKTQAQSLSGEGKNAFFFRLEDLADTAPKDTLSPEEKAAYQKWLNGTDKGWLFLDAVDEARLTNYNNFERALHRLAADIAPAMGRVHIILSSRGTAWREEDKGFLQTHFPTSAVNKKPKDHSVSELTKPVAILGLAALDDTQVKAFAAARIGEPERFIEDLNHHDAWTLTRRPYDVEALLAYWKERGRLGTFQELVEHDVQHKLRETNRRHASGLGTTPLATGVARRGAERLAAASVLTRQLAFSISSTAHPQDALIPGAVLDDWAGPDIHALLSRSLFDVAAFERVRFHHRHVGEYLAACWLRSQLDRGAPRAQVEDLLFRKGHGGNLVIPPSMAPVVAWLALQVDWVCRKALGVDPIVLLDHGDPAQLPLGVRQDVLQRVMAEASPLDTWRNDTSLRRLVSPELGPEIAQYLQKGDLEQDRVAVLLKLAREGRLADCADIAFSLGKDHENSWYIRVLSAQVLDAIGNQDRLAELVEAVKAEPELPWGFCDHLCDLVYPDLIDEDDLLHLLRIRKTAGRGSSGSSFSSLRHSVETIPVRRLAILMPKLVEETRQPPWVEEGQGSALAVSKKFVGMTDVIALGLARLISEPSQETMSHEQIAEIFEQYEILAEHYDGYEKSGYSRLSEALRTANPSIRSSIFWYMTIKEHLSSPEKNIWPGVFHRYTSPWIWQRSDFHWLLEDAYAKLLKQDRQFSFRVSAWLWGQTGYNFRDKLRLTTLALPKPELWLPYWKNVGSFPTRWTSKLYRNACSFLKYKRRHWWRYKVKRRFREALQSIRLRWACWKNREKMRQGEAFGLIVGLLQTLDLDWLNSEDSASVVQAVRKKYGASTETAFTEGLMALWRTWEPLQDFSVCYEGTQPTLFGIDLALQQGLALANLPESDVCRLTAHGLHKLNSFPDWFAELATQHPKTVSAVLEPILEKDFQTPRTVEHPSGPLTKLSYAEDRRLPALCAPVVARLLRQKEPDHLTILERALVLLLRTDQERDIAALARNRLGVALQGENAPHFYQWLWAWFLADLPSALNWLEGHFKTLPAEDAETLMVTLAARFDRRGFGDPRIKLGGVTAGALGQFLTILYKHIPPASDPKREGTFTPTSRDDAGSFRSHALSSLANIPGPGTYRELLRLAELPEFTDSAMWLRDLAKKRALQDAEAEPWQASDVAAFSQRYVRPPETGEALFTLVRARLEEIRDDAENGDFAPDGFFAQEDNEALIQRWLAGKLKDRSHGLYDVQRESETKDNRRSDIRVSHGVVGPVVIEIKWAHKKERTLANLKEAIKTQLLEGYMRARESRYGLFVVVNLDPDRKWQGESGRISFAELVEALTKEANTLSSRDPRRPSLHVVGIEIAARKCHPGATPNPAKKKKA